MNGLVIAVTFFGGAVAVIAGLRAINDRYEAGRVQGARGMSCAEALRSSGTVRLEGVAVPAPFPPSPVAPLSGRPYAWCEARVSYQDSDSDRGTRTVTVAHLPGGAFGVQDATGVVAVLSAEVDWHDLPYSVNTRSRRLPDSLRRAEVGKGSDLLEKVGLSEKWADRGAQFLFSGDGRVYGLTERLVAPGTPVVVVGELRPGSDGVAVLGGQVLASTEPAHEVVADHRAGARTSQIVAAVAAVVVIAVQLLGHFL